jgi:hypothetical protein
VLRFVVLVGALALAACTSSYHPEYHPVSVNNVSQSLAYPVTVHGGAPSHGGPVYVVPGGAAAGPPLAPPPPPAPPPGFFAPE